jgi:MtN3 and saliva related transmembrane protein
MDIMIEIIGFLAGALTLVGYLPQAAKTIRTRRTKDISLIGFFLIFTSALLWTIYGVAKLTPAIWVANSIVLACSAIVVIIKLMNIISRKEKA